MQSRMTFKNVVARVLASSDAYQKFGNDYALPPGVKAASVVFGNLTGTKNSVYADNNVPSNLADNFIPDLIIAGSDGKLYIFKGRVGGGYNSTADLVLNLPAGANPSQVVVGDLNGDGNVDIAVANFGDASGANPGSVRCVPQHPRPDDWHVLSFAAPRVDYAAGNNPIGIAIADIDGDSNVDIAVVNRSLTGAAYTADVLLGVGGGAFNDALPPIPLGNDFLLRRTEGADRHRRWQRDR